MAPSFSDRWARARALSACAPKITHPSLSYMIENGDPGRLREVVVFLDLVNEVEGWVAGEVTTRKLTSKFDCVSASALEPKFHPFHPLSTLFSHLG